MVPARQVLPIPPGISLLQAAALLEIFATACLNLFWEAGLQPSERALLHAGASGVGTAAIHRAEAQELVGRNATVGKVVLEVP